MQNCRRFKSIHMANKLPESVFLNCFDQQLWMKVHFRESKESTNCSEFFKEVNISYQCCLNREFERNDSVHLMSVSLESYTFKVAYLETKMWQILAFVKDRSKETVSMSLV